MATIMILAAAFLAGVIAGAVVLLSVGIAREESDGSLLSEPATRTSAAARRIMALRTLNR